MEEITLLINQYDKHKYTDNPLLINSDNVYLTYASVVRLNGNVYAVGGDDGSLKISYDKLCEHINLGDDVIINLNYKDYIIAGIIPKSLETKLKNAISNENYELAEIINTEINRKNDNKI